MNIIDILNDINNDFFIDNSPLDLEEKVQNGLIESKVIETKWLGNNPASVKDIEGLELRLSTKLPSSYKAFLLMSNGFRNISPFLDNLFSTEQIDWARNLEPIWSLDIFKEDPVEVSDEQYFYYEEDQDSVLSRTSYIPECLKISEWHNGMCLFLNPVIKFNDEWEVLEYATWYPGILRYKSFGEYLLRTHASNQRLIKNRERKNIS